MCSPGTIGNPYEGCGQEPRQSCTANTCGHGAVCRDGITDIECLCPPGYTGNPYIQCFGNQSKLTNLLWDFSFTVMMLPLYLTDSPQSVAPAKCRIGSPPYCPVFSP